MKKIAFILLALIISAGVLYGCTDNEIVDNTLTDSENQSEINNPDAETKDNVPGYKELYLETVTELNSRYEDVEWSYGLIDVNGDETPELVASYPATVSLYTYADGKIYIVMEETTYGFAGNNGYYYLPGQNVIFNSNYDMAGAIVYETYCKIGEKHEIENYHNKPFYTSVWKDANGDGMPDDSEIGDTVYYYYGNDEITEEAYNDLRFGDEASFESLYGEMSYDDIIAELNK